MIIASYSNNTNSIFGILFSCFICQNFVGDVFVIDADNPRLLSFIELSPLTSLSPQSSTIVTTHLADLFYIASATSYIAALGN